MGLAAEQTKITTDYALTQNMINDGIIYGSVRFDHESGSHLNIDTEIRFNEHETGFKIAAANLWKLRKNQGIFANIAYSQTMTNIESSLWFWSEKGYDFVREQGGDYTIEGTLRPAKQWSLDLSWQRDEDILPSIRAGILYRGFLRKNLGRAAF